MASLLEILAESNITLGDDESQVKLASGELDTSVNLDKDSIEKLAETLDAFGEEDSLLDEMAKIAVLQDMINLVEASDEHKAILKEAGLALPPYAETEPDRNRFEYLAERIANGERLLPGGTAND